MRELQRQSERPRGEERRIWFQHHRGGQRHTGGEQPLLQESSHWRQQRQFVPISITSQLYPMKYYGIYQISCIGLTVRKNIFAKEICCVVNFPFVILIIYCIFFQRSNNAAFALNRCIWVDIKQKEELQTKTQLYTAYWI